MSHHVLLRLQKSELHIDQILETDPAWFHDPHWVSTGARKPQVHGLPLDAAMTFCEDCGRDVVAKCRSEDLRSELQRSQLLEEEHCAECMKPLDFIVTDEWVYTQMAAFDKARPDSSDVEYLSRLRDGIDVARKNLTSEDLSFYCEMVEHHINAYVEGLRKANII